MAKKRAVRRKNRGKKAQKSKGAASVKPSKSKSVEIREVSNGFVVATHDEKTFEPIEIIAKTKADADKAAAKLLK